MKGSGASGNRRRAAVRSPPCRSDATPMSGLSVTLTFLALLIEVLVGYPDRLVGAIGHPVTWMGRLLAALDARLNNPRASNARGHMAGAAAVFILVAVSAMIAYVAQRDLLLLPLGIVWAALAA